MWTASLTCVMLLYSVWKVPRHSWGDDMSWAGLYGQWGPDQLVRRTAIVHILASLGFHSPKTLNVSKPEDCTLNFSHETCHFSVLKIMTKLPLQTKPSPTKVSLGRNLTMWTWSIHRSFASPIDVSLFGWYYGENVII